MTEKLSKLDVVREQAARAGAPEAACYSCLAYQDLVDGDMGICERRQEQQFRFGICLSWTAGEYEAGDRDEHPIEGQLGDRSAGRCAEDGCDGLLELRQARDGKLFYGCCNWPECEGALPANEDGTPRGEPRTRELMGWRNRAHEVFDKLWQDGHCKRGAAYSWLRHATGLDHHDAHMFKMDIGQCKMVIEVVGTKGPGTEFWEQWKTERAERKREQAKGRKKRRRSRKG